jgi:dephospho-CoA kinase
MLVVGLTGGIGSGKSSVASRLVDRGAVLIDADALVREVQSKEGPAFGPIVEAFGPEVVGSDGELDRQAIADVVFNDKDRMAVLTGITYPLIGQRMAEKLAENAETDNIVILDIPLLVESTRDPLYSEVIVVDTPEDVAVDRLVRFRGFTEADARARIANQASRADRLARASFVIDNSGSESDLDAEVDRCWAWLSELSAGGVVTPDS